MITFDVCVNLKNEEVLLPYFLEYYGNKTSCRKITAIDNFSTDKSCEILAAHPKVELHSESSDATSIDAIRAWQNSIWTKSTGKVDFVLILCVDEFIGPDLEQKLELYSNYPVIAPKGHDMISEDFRNPFDVVAGSLNEMYSKPCIINPNTLNYVNFNVGTHAGDFGSIEPFRPDDLFLYHFRYLGRDRTWQRFLELDAMRTQVDVDKGQGYHYRMTRAEFDILYDKKVASAIELPKINSINV